MVDYREILRLRSLGDSIRNIARSVCSGRDTVSEVLKAAEAAGISASEIVTWSSISSR